MDIIYFKDKGITAGFTQAPDLSDVRRSAMAEQAALEGGYVIRPCLVHGTYVLAVTKDYLDDKPSYIEVEACDGLVTDIPDVTLTSTHGDCIPVFVCDNVKKVIGLAHAGWRGTADGIAYELAGIMTEKYNCDPKNISAVIGPGIGLCHFEVSEDVAESFLKKQPWCGPFIEKGVSAGKYMIDLKGINAELLRKAGITDIEISPVCTYEDINCYSYRRNGTQNRMLAYIKI